MQHTRAETGDEGPDFIAGALCLDFANTVEGTHQAPTRENVGSYAELIGFAQAAGALTATQARHLLLEAKRHPQLATQMYRRAISLREAVARVFSALAAGQDPPETDLETIGVEAADAQAHARFVGGGATLRWDWPIADPSLARPLWPISSSARDVLTSGRDRASVRECASSTCGWLFLDRSRSHSRRWCDMSGCGNRAKQRRFQQRRRD